MTRVEADIELSIPRQRLGTGAVAVLAPPSG